MPDSGSISSRLNCHVERRVVTSKFTVIAARDAADGVMRMSALTAITRTFDLAADGHAGSRVQACTGLSTPFNHRKFPPFVPVDGALSSAVHASGMSRTKAPIQDNVPERAAVQDTPTPRTRREQV